jgi:hypothetical protein
VDGGRTTQRWSSCPVDHTFLSIGPSYVTHIHTCHLTREATSYLAHHNYALVSIFFL